MTVSAYFTDSLILPEGRGGDVVSFHELQALQSATHVRSVYQHVGKLLVQETYPNNPYMYDYYMASIIEEPQEIELAQFYGSNWTVTMKVLHDATKIATCPAHNLELSLEEWAKFKYWAPPPIHLTDPFLFELGAQGLKTCDAVVCPSTASEKYLKKRLNLTNTTVIPHGVNLPEKWSAERKPFMVFHLSQFGPDKGQTYLIDAWSRLKLQDSTCVMACQNLKECSIPLPPNFQVYGAIPAKDKEQLYAHASVYVQPSVTEGWGLTVGEAMSHGTPVIVTEGVGASDMVTDGQDGFIVPIRDPDALAEKIKYFHNNPAEVERMGINARRKAECYDWKTIEAKYVELLRA